MGPHVFGWKSARAHTAVSAQEAEIKGMAQSLGLGLRVGRLVEKLAGEVVEKTLESDTSHNAAALVACTKEDFFEDEVRARHFAMRMSWIRDQCCAHQVHVSDALTKILGNRSWAAVLWGDTAPAQ